MKGGIGIEKINSYLATLWKNGAFSAGFSGRDEQSVFCMFQHHLFF